MITSYGTDIKTDFEGNTKRKTLEPARFVIRTDPYDSQLLLASVSE